MQSFSLPGFLTHLGGAIATIELAQLHAIEKAAKIVEKESKRVLGTHDYDWPPLAASTIARKKTGDSPLLETSEMKESIQHKVVSPHEAHVGSDLDKSVWMELGTSRAPARSFLMQAAVHKEEAVHKAVGDHMHNHLIYP